MRAHYVQDYGSYLQMLTPLISQLTFLMSPGAYAIPEVDVKVTNVYTNTVPTDALRGAGRPGGDARDRADDGHAGRTSSGSPAPRSAGVNFPDGVPVHDRDRAAVRLGRLRQDARQAARAVRRQGDVRAAPGRGGRPRQAARPRPLDLGRDVRVRAVGRRPKRARADAGRLGELDRAHAPDRQGHGHHRHLAARPGPRHVVVADRRDRARRPVRRRRGDPRRHGVRAVRARHLRQPQPGRRRHGGAPGRRARCATRRRLVAAQMLEAAPDDLEFADGAFCVKGSPDKRATIQEVAFRAWQAFDMPEGVDAGPGRDGVLRPAQLRVPVRRPRLRGRGRPRHRQGRDHRLHRRGRLRQRHQPDDRGRPGARRRRRTASARRSTRGPSTTTSGQLDDRHAGRLPRAVGRSSARTSRRTAP